MTMHHRNQLLSEIAAKPTFRSIDGVYSVRGQRSGKLRRSVAQSVDREHLRLRSNMVASGGNEPPGRDRPAGVCPFRVQKT